MMNSSRLPSRSAYRSFRYSLNRQQNVRTADPSSLPKFRIKKNSVLQSTMMRTGGLEEMQMSKTLPLSMDPEKNSYLKNFYSLMDSQRKVTIGQRSKWAVKPLKFKIQNMKQLEQSQFTLLDPFQVHYSSIQTHCKNASKQIQMQSQQLRKVKGQLMNLNKKINVQLSQIEKSSSNQLQKFVSLLKQNTIKQQQIKLKFKQDLAMLEIQHDEQIQKGQQILQRNKQLQDTIFSCYPYQLRENQQYNKDMQNTNTTFGIKEGTLC